MVKIHNREYKTVAERISQLHESHPGHYFEIEVVKLTEDEVVIQAHLHDAEGKRRGSGTAHESRTASQINRTSFIEVAETSACGRCLALNVPGLAGSEVTSAEELDGALKKQQVIEIEDRYKSHIAALLMHHDSVMAIKAACSAFQASGDPEDLQPGARAFYTLDDDDKRALWSLSPSAGSCFTTAEKATMKLREFRESYYGGDE